LAAGFFLLPAVGLRATTWVGVALNVLAAAGAWWISAKAPDLPAQTLAASPTNSLPRRSSRRSRASEGGRSPRLNVDTRAPSPLLACGAVALSGFAALVYEVAWTRLLALVIGPTTYAFATMAAAFIAGLAIGSAAGARVVRRSARPAVWLAAMLTVSAVGAAAAAYVAATRMPL